MSAEDVFFWSNWALVGALVRGLLSTYAIVVSGISRDRTLKRDLASATAVAETARSNAAAANERAEELRNTNLGLEKQLLDLQKNVRGREITDEQHDQVVAGAKGLKIPDLVTYIVRDPEARTYGLSLIFLFQELGMPGRTVLLDNAPPMQTGVMYCGSGTPEDAPFMKLLMDARIVGVGSPDPYFGHDKDGKEIELPYCPRGSVFVGLRQSISTLRVPKKDP